MAKEKNVIKLSEQTGEQLAIMMQGNYQQLMQSQNNLKEINQELMRRQELQAKKKKE